jgi:hypothetical protein
MRILAGTVLLWVAVPAFAEELVQSFRGGRYDAQRFRYDGPTPEQFIQPESEGLRWRFSPGKGPPRPVGIYWRTPVRGDFAVTVSLEILPADRPDRWGNGPGAELYVALENPSADGLALTCRALPRGGSVVELTHMTTLNGKRVLKEARLIPTPFLNERARLRLAREGPTLIASAADGDAQPPREFHRVNLGTAGVRMVRFAGTPGQSPEAGLDMRLLEFRLAVQDPGRLGPSIAQPAPAATPDRPGSPGRLAWGSALAATLVLPTAAVFLWRRRSKARALAGPAPDKRPSPPAALPGQPVIVLPCTHCGKRLKVKEEAAGKRVKCPGCGQATAVPLPGPASRPPRPTP